MDFVAQHPIITLIGVAMLLSFLSKKDLDLKAGEFHMKLRSSADSQPEPLKLEVLQDIVDSG
jgi:hypothetical protein